MVELQHNITIRNFKSHEQYHSGQIIPLLSDRYDGTIESLACQTRRPHSWPNQHTEQKLKLIRDMRRRIENLRLFLRCERPEPKEKPEQKYQPEPYELKGFFSQYRNAFPCSCRAVGNSHMFQIS